MTQEELVSGLKERVGDNSFSDQTFEIAAKNALPLFADDSKVTDETWNFPVGLMKGLNGQYNADVASQVNSQKEKLSAENKIAQEKWQQDFKAQWEKDHPVPTPPAPPAPTPTPENGDDKIAAAVAKAMEAQNKKLFGEDGKTGILGQMSDFIKQSQTQAREAKISSIRKELKDYLVEKGANLKQREPLINLTVKQLQIDENSDIDRAKIDVEKAYEKNYKDFYGDGGKPFGGDSAGGGASTADADMKKYLQTKAEAAKKEAEAADNLRKKFK